MEPTPAAVTLPSDLARSRSRRALRLFLQAVVLPALLLGILELGLRWAGYGTPTTLFLPHAAAQGDLLAVNYQVGWRFFPSHMARRPLPEMFPAAKADGTCRVFVLGESAARGEFLADFSFSRMLGEMLPLAWPGTRFEVINTGIPAINSWVLREFAREIAGYRPDLVIVYAGHNEVVGPYGPGTVFAPMAPRRAIQAEVWLSDLRLTQFARAAADTFGFGQAHAAPAGWKGLEMFQDHLLPATDPRLAECAWNFQANVEDIIRVSRQAGAQVIVCQVPSNLADCPPFASVHTPGLATGPASPWGQAFAAGCSAQEAGQATAARDAFARAAALDPLHAETRYRLGRAHLALGQTQEARDAFRQARDLDALHVRTGTAGNAALAAACRAVGPDPEVVRLDLESEFDRQSPHGITGRDLVYDHVHLTVDGHLLVAETLMQSLRLTPPARLRGTAPTAGSDRNEVGRPSPLPPQMAAKNAGFAPRQATAPRAEILRRLGYSVRDELTNRQNILASYRRPPFTAWLDHAARCRALEAEIAALRAQVAGQGPELFATVAQQAEAFPERADLRLRLAQLSVDLGRPEEALVHFDQALARNPFHIDAYNNRGLVHLALGNLASATADFRAATAIAPNFAGGHFNLAITLARTGQPDEAMREYAQTLRYDPGYLKARLNLGNLLLHAGRTAEALSAYQEAVAVASDSAEAHLNLANALMKEGHLGEAMAGFTRATALDPRSVAAHYGMGMALTRAGREAEAVGSFLAALAADPAHLPSLRQAALLLATSDNPDARAPARAVDLAERAAHLTGNRDAGLLQILAAAYAADGRPADAARATRLALDLANGSGDAALATDLRDNLARLEEVVR